ncbi:protein of unknown function [Sporanaerobacter acetigenes DSM 13106]|uniref:DUF2935 domain-containing protein n=1 Tax=Sporanaerobacter acetigenes DSM 13106 TaxID=1123281 RepID=A0A1M5VW40_9FIRM|nr:protein of unknown function [Sporanaerobacter acetigenes DSM 13106]
MTREEYISYSLEYNMFFSRIMKEHLIFVESALPIVNSGLILEVDRFKETLEDFLMETILLSNGIMDEKVISSNELVTPYTLKAEMITEYYTGICINTDITKLQTNLVPKPCPIYPEGLYENIHLLNIKGINLMNNLISIKEDLYKSVLECKVYIWLYPHLLKHVIEEAEIYLKILEGLENLDENVIKDELVKREVFWNEIMKEHSEFIRGLLDPTEKILIDTADEFAELFEKLEEEAKEVLEKKLPPGEITKKSKKATEDIIEFKTSAVKGLTNCKIKAIILPLLADHVLREANHYLRLLKTTCI